MTLITTGAMERALIETPEGRVGDFLQKVHQLVQTTLNQDIPDGESDDGMELGVCFLPSDGKHMRFAAARFDLFIVQDGEVEILRSTKSGIGYRGIPFDQSFQEHDLSLSSAQSIYLTSDGLIDQVGGERGRAFGKKRFSALLREIEGKPMAEQQEAVHQALIAYQGAQHRRDDVAVIGFRL